MGSLGPVTLVAAAGALACLLVCLGHLAYKYRLERREPKVTPEQVNEARRQKRIMEELIEHPGWKMLQEIAASQTGNRKNNILLKPTEQPYEQEYMKGEVQGIEMLMKIPASMIESAQAIISRDMKNDDADAASE